MTAPRDESGDANELTCAIMDETAKLAEAWVRRELHEAAFKDLWSWVRLRMRAYKEHGWDGDREPMIEWIAIDLAIDDEDARRLCEEAGWIEGASS